ncbi:heme-copper oxidase subunit III [Microbacterium amylolyticum]|uniref:cytochrome-c oxidase n=2 Tax=Microbacterium amylolyticum TaxID=936337 RepID=A0ABS4ZFZ7_9MICO|nr:cytochrome c oxidase subunit 3 [Microbacterium amylolyticum]
MTTPATYAPAPRTVKRPDPVSVGTIVWLGSEVMFFAGLFAIYFTLRSTSPGIWEEGTQALNVTFAFINTAILVTSSVTCQFGVLAAERMQPYTVKGQGWRSLGMVPWFWITFALGATFVAGQVWEYAQLVEHGVTISSDPYGAAFYLTTGFHGLHVAGGLIAMLLTIGRVYAVKKFTHKEATTTIVVSYYWHFVDIVWIALFAVIYFLQ